MALHHVAQRPGAVVVAGPAFNANRLGRGDLHVVDVVPIPDRLEEDVGEAKGQNVLNGFFPEVVIDAIDLALGEASAISWIRSRADWRS